MRKLKTGPVIILLIVYIVFATIIPIVVKNLVFNASYDSLLQNGGWASFLGSYIGGVLGGIGTLLALYLTLKNTIELQRINKKDTDAQIEQSNAKRDEEYLRDKRDRKNERIFDEKIRKQNARKIFADGIAELLGKYIADISNYHYASVFLHMYYIDMNRAYGEYKNVYDKLILAYEQLENSQNMNHEEQETLCFKINRMELQCNKMQMEYEDKRKSCEDNSKRCNRIIANEALFTMESKLNGIAEAESFLRALHEVHLKSSSNQDENINKQVGSWMERETQNLESLYREFREAYVSGKERIDAEYY